MGSIHGRAGLGAGSIPASWLAPPRFRIGWTFAALQRLSDHDADSTLNVSSDSRLILSLHRLGLVSLEPALAANATDLASGVSPDVDHSQ
jgi:hypothetical protein